MITFRGSCHCGALDFVYSSELPPEQWSVRACQCSFCRAHGAHYTSDPAGQVRFVHRDVSQLQRYRFGLKTADFLLCRKCGVFMGAVMAETAGVFVAINVNVFVDPKPRLPAALLTDFDAESREARILRRLKKWTPVVPDLASR